MANPLFKQINKQVDRMPNMEQFKQALSKQDNSFLQRMQQLARQRGIPEQDIQAGMRFIESIKQ